MPSGALITPSAPLPIRRTGSGTSFRVLLPPEPERGTERAAPAPPAVLGDPSGRILVVDDDPPMLSLMQHFLERARFEVIPALGGRKALFGIVPVTLRDENVPVWSYVNVVGLEEVVRAPSR